MTKRARSTAILVCVAATIGLLGWWMSVWRGGSSARTGAGTHGAPAILTSDGGAPVEEDPKPVVDGVVQPDYRSVTLSGGRDAGGFATEQPPVDYTGDVADEVPFEPEVEAPILPPGAVALSSAELAERRQGQVELIDRQIESLDAQIDRARDLGEESVLGILEARRARLRTRRDTLAGM